MQYRTIRIYYIICNFNNEKIQIIVINNNNVTNEIEFKKNIEICNNYIISVDIIIIFEFKLNSVKTQMLIF